MTQTQDPPLDLWGIVELMGHRRLAGRLTEQTVAGVVLLRVDVPALDGSLSTQFYGGQAIYCLTPTTEEVARAVALRHQPEPVYRYELPVLAQASRAIAEDDAEEGEEYDDFEHPDQIDPAWSHTQVAEERAELPTKP